MALHLANLFFRFFRSPSLDFSFHFIIVRIYLLFKWLLWISSDLIGTMARHAFNLHSLSDNRTKKKEEKRPQQEQERWSGWRRWDYIPHLNRIFPAKSRYNFRNLISFSVGLLFWVFVALLISQQFTLSSANTVSPLQSVTHASRLNAWDDCILSSFCFVQPRVLFLVPWLRRSSSHTNRSENYKLCSEFGFRFDDFCCCLFGIYAALEKLRHPF